MENRQMAENMQRTYAESVAEFKAVSAELEKLVAPRPGLVTQLQEIEMVKDEMDRVGDDEQVYKLVGPVLVKQEVDEAKMNVQKRFDYTKENLDRIEAKEKDLEAKRGKIRDKIMTLQAMMTKLQQQMQQQMQQAQAKAQQAK